MTKGYEPKPYIHKPKGRAPLICPECRRVWQLSKEAVGAEITRAILEYFPELPRLGLKKKVCPKCKEKV